MQKETLKYIFKIDAKLNYFKGEDIYISKKSDTDRLECYFLDSSPVKKYVKKYTKEDKIDLDEFPESKYDFYKKLSF